MASELLQTATKRRLFVSRSPPVICCRIKHSLFPLHVWACCVRLHNILRHRGVQLILAYGWARPAVLVAGKDRGGMFYFFRFFTFIPVPLSSLSLSFISSTISSIYFLPFSGRGHKKTHKGWRSVKPQHNQSIDCIIILLVPTTMTFIFNVFHAVLIQQTTNWWYFSYFSQKARFDISYKLSPSPLETICRKCQILFPGKNKKDISKCRLLKNSPGVLSVNWYYCI